MSLRRDYLEGGEFPDQPLAYGYVVQLYSGRQLEHYAMARIGPFIAFLAWPTSFLRTRYTNGRFYIRWFIWRLGQ